MDEITEFLKFLHGAGASIIPWLVVVMLVWLVVYLRPYFCDYLKGQKEAKLLQAKHEGERNEIIRNCTATIEACTAVLDMAKRDRSRVIEHIDKHEQLSVERMEHIQTVVNQCRDEVLKARGDMEAIKAKLD